MHASQFTRSTLARQTKGVVLLAVAGLAVAGLAVAGLAIAGLVSAGGVAVAQDRAIERMPWANQPPPPAYDNQPQPYQPQPIPGRPEPQYEPPPQPYGAQPYGSQSSGPQYGGPPSSARPDDAYRPPARSGPTNDPYAQAPAPPYRTGGQQSTVPGGYGSSDNPAPAYGQPYEAAPARGRDPYNEPPRGDDGQRDGTFSMREINHAGHGFFGSISQGLASVIEYAFKKQGRPNGYILGEDVGGAFVAGLRYGEGTLYTKDAGNHKVYWQGPSVGYDAGAEGSKVMVLVYNLREPGDIYQRYGGIAGSAYVIGGVGLTFQSHGDVILAPIRAGIGLRLGANIGYLKYSRRPTWNPF